MKSRNTSSRQARSSSATCRAGASTSSRTGEGLIAARRRAAAAARTSVCSACPASRAGTGSRRSASPRRARRSWSRAPPARRARSSSRWARSSGCRVVGTAGTDEKCAWLTQGARGGCRHQLQEGRRLRRRAARGLPQGRRRLLRERRRADPRRRAAPGQPVRAHPALRDDLAVQPRDRRTPARATSSHMIGNRVLMQGFIISDHFDRYPEFVGEVGGWLEAGRIKSRGDRGRGHRERAEGLPRPLLRRQPGQDGRAAGPEPTGSATPTARR